MDSQRPVDSPIADLPEELARKFEIVRHIGDESFGSLFLARDTELRRDVVIKVLRREYIQNREARLRFEREARAAARINHANVVSVFWVDKLSSGVPFLVEPYVGDCTLREKLKSVGRFQPTEVRKILLQLGMALEAAHARGIVHRDVRPGTVRCKGNSEHLLLTDFGIAGVLESAGLDWDTITYPGEVVGSPGYMSPEQRDTNEVTDRSDIYSLGVLAWHLLAGSAARVPSVGEGMDRSAMLSVAPDAPDLIDLIARCLRDNAEDRPSAASIVHEMEAAAGRRSWYRTSLTVLFERWLPLVAIGMIVSAIGIAAFMLDFLTSPPKERALVVTFLAAAFLAALVVTVFHGKKGRQAVTRTEIWLLRAIGAVWFVVTVILWRVIPTS